MSTYNQKEHFIYTTNEWNSIKHQNYLDIIFKNNDINVIYDIGANVGGTSYIFLEYSRKNNKNIKKIYCFEPDKDNINFLKLKLNEEINNNLVEPIQKGIYYGKKKARVFGAGHVSEGYIHPNVGGYGIEECMKEYVKYRNEGNENVFCDQIEDKEFELDELENLMKKSLKPDFIKIDIEGSEKNLLENSILINESKYIILEWNQKEDLNDFLKNNNLNFEILKSDCDYLLINKNYKNN